MNFFRPFSIIYMNLKCDEIMKRILYIHGFNGSPTGNTYKNILDALPKGYELYSIDYDESNCRKARMQILDYISEHNIDLVIGSSLGGFIALTLTGIPRFLINPCWVPSAELDKLTEPGHEYEEMISTYEAYEGYADMCVDNKEKALVKGFFGTNDEILGVKYVKEFAKKFNCYEMIESGHHLSKEGAKQIFVNIDKYWKSINKYISK